MGSRWVGPEKRVRQVLKRQYMVITRSQALRAGYPEWKVRQLVENNRWAAVYRAVYCPADLDLTENGRLMAACLATGGRASHQSAARLWDFMPRAPRHPVVSVGPSSTVGHPGITIHRASDLPRVAGRWRGIIPSTDPARTLADLAAVLSEDDLDAAIDRAVAQHKVDMRDLDQARRHARGRRGAGALRRSLQRGYTDGPAPSVLEARFARLLRRHGYRVERERPVTWDGALYRLDFLVEGKLPVEVDGFAFHATAGDLIRDRRRHNALKLAEMEPLIFTWWDLEHDEARVIHDVRRGLEQWARRTA